MSHEEREPARLDPDGEAAAPEDVFEQFPETSPDELAAMADGEDPAVTETAREVGELLAEQLRSNPPADVQ